MKIDKKIAERLAEIRKIKGLTQVEFSKILKIDRSTLSGLENGLVSLTDRNVQMICLAYDVNEEWLLKGIGDIFCPIEQAREGKKILEIYEKLEQEGKEQIQVYVQERLDLQNLRKDKDKAWDDGQKGKK
jgi:transcriptional regulator with XRE-family HTH domain